MVSFKIGDIPFAWKAAAQVLSQVMPLDKPFSSARGLSRKFSPFAHEFRWAAAL
jgi:hypothetical protein